MADRRRPFHVTLVCTGNICRSPMGEVILRDLLQADTETFDYILMDCAPSLGVLTLNALCSANEVFIPLQPHFLALHGLSKLLETTALVSKRAK